MTHDKFDFGPKDEKEAVIFAQEASRVDFQVAVHEAMLRKGISSAQLEDILGKRRGYLTYLMGDHANPTIHTVAHVCHALGIRLNFTT